MSVATAGTRPSEVQQRALFLAMTQVALVARGRTGRHRQFGRIAFALAPAMVIIGMVATRYAIIHGFHDVPVPPAAFSTVPLLDLVLFAAL